MNSEKIFQVFPNRNLWELMSPGARPVWTVGALLAFIYVGEHLSLLPTKYLSSGPYGFNDENLIFFFDYNYMELISPGGMASLDPSGMVGRIYKGDHLTLLNTKYLSSGPHGFRENLSFFPL